MAKPVVQPYDRHDLVSRVLQLLAGLWKHTDLLVILLIALFLRLAFFQQGLNDVGLEQMALASPDAVLYLDTARSLVDNIPIVEKGLFTFGPGYPVFLAIGLLFGCGILGLVIVNILVSALTSLMIYRLARLLIDSYPIAIVAALLSATSYTSISLSPVLLSDTFFLFLLTAGLVLYYKALTDSHWVWFIVAGLIFGFAALCRAVGQFWPVIMILLALVVSRSTRSRLPHVPANTLRRRRYRVAVAVAIPVLMITAWTIRNYSRHDAFTLTLSGTAGLGKLAAITIGDIEDQPYRSVLKRWGQAYLDSTGQETFTLGQEHDFIRDRAKQTLSDHPEEVLSTYVDLLWQNINEISYLHRLVIPELNATTIPIEYWYKDRWLNYLSFTLTMIGLVILICTARYRPAIILGLVYVYFIPLSGFAAHQGSRIFLPAQTASAILIAVVLVTPIKGITRLMKSIRD